MMYDFYEADERDPKPVEWQRAPRMAFRVLLVLGITAFAMFVALIVMAADAGAHDWFPAFCCQGDADTGDCDRIPHQSVKPIPGGYRITLVPGDHRKVTSRQVFEIMQSETRESPDGEYYGCLFPTQEKLRCFFAPVPGV